VMDADSVLVPEFLQTAMERLEADPDLMAVGGVFYGERGSGLVGQLQRNEYTRYQVTSPGVSERSSCSPVPPRCFAPMR